MRGHQGEAPRKHICAFTERVEVTWMQLQAELDIPKLDILKIWGFCAS